MHSVPFRTADACKFVCSSGSCLSCRAESRCVELQVTCDWSADGNEADTGKGIAAALSSGKVAREDLFIVSKLAPTSEEMNFEGVEKATRACLKDLQLEYLDLMLIHWPVHSDRPEEKVDPPLSVRCCNTMGLGQQASSIQYTSCNQQASCMTGWSCHASW